MASLEQRFNEWLKGKKLIQEQMATTAINAEDVCEKLLKAIRTEARDVSFPSEKYPQDIDGWCGEKKVVNGNVRIPVFLDHDDFTRTPFYSGGKWDEADLVILMNNGWSFDPSHPGYPRGDWHGENVAALAKGPKNSACIGFIQRAVTDFECNYNASVEINEVYK